MPAPFTIFLVHDDVANSIEVPLSGVPGWLHLGWQLADEDDAQWLVPAPPAPAVDVITRTELDAFVAADIVDPESDSAAALSATFATLIQQAKDPDGIIQGAITRDTNGAATSAGVVWNDGATGTYTADLIDSNGAVLGYHITHVAATTETYTQPTMTRDTAGAVTNRPAIVVT